MAKVLNLDEVLVAEPRELVLGGKTYQIVEASVEDFIHSQAVRKELEADPENTELQMRKTAEAIVRQVPGLEVGALMGLSLERMSAVAAFVRGLDVETIIAAASGTPSAPAAAEGDAPAAAEGDAPKP